MDFDTSSLIKYFTLSNLGKIFNLDDKYIAVIAFFIYVLYNIDYSAIHLKMNIHSIYSMVFTKRELILSGSQTMVVHEYNTNPITSGNYSDEFQAVIKHIIENVEDIRRLRYLFVNIMTRKSYYAKEFTNNGIYVVDQREYFCVCPKRKIYGYTKICQDDSEDHKKKVCNISIDIHLYSYYCSTADIRDFVEQKKNILKEEIANAKKNKLFTYKLTSTPNDDDSLSRTWMESEFESVKTFDNIFFPEKNEIVEKINFFLNNKDWYKRNGVPYTLGFCLHGSPGTGKTSFTKALANHCKRHLIEMSFKYLKTPGDLHKAYYETTYDRNNDNGTIGFGDKIYLFEDIDCASDIVYQRKSEIEHENTVVVNNGSSNDPSAGDVAVKVLNEIISENNKDVKVSENYFSTEKSPKITQDDILNIFDGIQESTGRILVMTTNHYSKLDDAIIRAGRIDVNIEFKNATPETVKEMYFHFTGNTLILTKNKKFDKSPADIQNYILKSMGVTRGKGEKAMAKNFLARLYE